MKQLLDAGFKKKDNTFTRGDKRVIIDGRKGYLYNGENLEAYGALDGSRFEKFIAQEDAKAEKPAAVVTETVADAEVAQLADGEAVEKPAKKAAPKKTATKTAKKK